MDRKLIVTLEEDFKRHFTDVLEGTPNHEAWYNRRVNQTGYSKECLDRESNIHYGKTLRSLFYYTRLLVAARRAVTNSNPESITKELHWYGYADLDALSRELKSWRGLTLNEFRLRLRRG